MNKKPNILFAIADDASHMGAYGHKFVNTPNFDAVAKDGILFTNAFTTNPKCAPSRASILAGMHTWQMEEAGNHFGVFPSKFKVFPDLLEDNGYHVGYTGKGWSPGDWEKGGFNRNPAGTEYNNRFLVPPENTRISDKDYTENFKDFLSEKSDDKPFCFWYGGHEPHRKYIPGEGLRAGKKLDDVDVPAYWPDEESVRSDMLDYASEIDWFDMHLGKMIKILKETGEFDNTIIVVTSDNGMPFPRVKGQMYEQDVRLPLAICWKAMTKSDRVVDDLVSFIDFAPTFLEAAGVDIHSQMGGKSLLNILKADRSGIVDESRDCIYTGRERHDVGREGDTGYPVRCIRTHDYLYIRNLKPERWPSGNPETGYTDVDSSPTKTSILNKFEQGDEYYYNLTFAKRPMEELYQIKNDPECMNNLADKDEFQEIKNQLWANLKNKLIQTKDPRILGGGDAFEGYEYVGGKRHSWKAYQEGWFQKQGH
ncbi:MAG: sulfatase [Firmicutes bacterium]|nr:sulfatase [Bacillota bacterium]